MRSIFDGGVNHQITTSNHFAVSLNVATKFVSYWKQGHVLVKYEDSK